MSEPRRGGGFSLPGTGSVASNCSTWSNFSLPQCSRPGHRRAAAKSYPQEILAAGLGDRPAIKSLPAMGACPACPATRGRAQDARRAVEGGLGRPERRGPPARLLRALMFAFEQIGRRPQVSVLSRASLPSPSGRASLTGSLWRPLFLPPGLRFAPAGSGRPARLS
jgi:hypothetical protein